MAAQPKIDDHDLQSSNSQDTFRVRGQGGCGEWFGPLDWLLGHPGSKPAAQPRSPLPLPVCILLSLGGPSGTEFMDSANKFLSSLQLKLDQEGSDRGTLHQWVRLLLRFMATVDMDGGTQGIKNRRGAPTDELKDKKSLSKVQRHLALLLGYADQTFNIPPYKLRSGIFARSKRQSNKPKPIISRKNKDSHR